MVAAAVPENVSSNNKSEKKLKPAATGWRSVLSALKQQIKILSPVRCLAATRDSYVRGMNNFAANSGSMMVQGPHIGALSRNASRSVSNADDDFYQLVRAASRKNAEFGDLGSAALPRSASVQEQGSKFRISNAQDHHNSMSRQQHQYPRSVSHTGISRFHVQKTILESTQEE